MRTSRGKTGVWALVCLALSAGASAAPAAAQASDPAFVWDLTGRVQVQASTTSVDADDVPVEPAASAFEMRRVRLGAGFAYDRWITGEVEADFAGGGARLTNGFVDLAVDDRLAVRAGQFKKPFGVFELESSTRIRTIERGVRIRGLGQLVGVPAETQYLLVSGGYAGRQVGVMAHGAMGRLGYAVGVFNGEGANLQETSASKAVAGRVTWAARSPLVLGAAVSRQPTGLSDGPVPLGDEVHGTAVELDATWGGFRQPGLHARAEWMLGDSPLTATGSDLPTMTGIHGLVSWFAPRDGRVEGWEPVLRLAWADPSTELGGDSGLLVTPGLNLYFNGRNRLMANADVYVPEQDGMDPELALVAQLQIHF